MLSNFMLTCLRNRLPLSVYLVLLSAAACEKVPLLAPSGSTITLTPSINALPANPTPDVTAQVLERSGTAPHSGSQVSLTPTLGTIQPEEALTDVSGRVTVKFKAGPASGTATIAASSGGATTNSTAAVKILVGSAAVGRVSVSASPTSVPAVGGSSVITANI